MGIDIYAKWKGQTEAEYEAQIRLVVSAHPDGSFVGCAT